MQHDSKIWIRYVWDKLTNKNEVKAFQTVALIKLVYCCFVLRGWACELDVAWRLQGWPLFLLFLLSRKGGLHLTSTQNRGFLRIFFGIFDLSNAILACLRHRSHPWMIVKTARGSSYKLRVQAHWLFFFNSLKSRGGQRVVWFSSSDYLNDLGIMLMSP